MMIHYDQHFKHDEGDHLLLMFKNGSPYHRDINVKLALLKAAVIRYLNFS